MFTCIGRAYKIREKCFPSEFFSHPSSINPFSFCLLVEEALLNERQAKIVFTPYQLFVLSPEPAVPFCITVLIHFVSENSRTHRGS